MLNKNLVKQKIIDDLKPLQPEKIIFFGSFLKDEYIEGKSDIDLLIIKQTHKSLADRFSEARLALKQDFPFDIFVFNEKELREKLATSFFFREIVKKGDLVYERK